MKRVLPVIFLLAILSVISGVLMSEMNFIGRIGVSWVHKEYHFLKIWWQGALAVFGALLVLFTIQGVLKMRLGKGANALAQIVLFLLSLGALYITYSDFRHNLSHKIIGERFHLGIYLFFISWMIISLFHLFSNKTTTPKVDAEPTKPATNR